MRLTTQLFLLAPIVLAVDGCRTPRDPSPDRSPEPSSARVERRLIAMGTSLVLEVVAANRAIALSASEAAARAIEAVEARLSTWRDDSELARLNRAAVGVPFALSTALAADLARANELRRATSGAFDPGVGAFVRLWGLRTGGRRPDVREIGAALDAGGLGTLELTERTATRRSSEVTIEEGGFGKGVGLDAALAALHAAGAESAVIDLGGQIAVLARATAPVDVTYGLAHPQDRDAPVLELSIASGSIATSSNSERGIVVDGERLAHIIDPRTGRPVRDFGSLTVWARDATTADALSTGLYVMGPVAALEWARCNDSIEVIVLEVAEDGELRASATSGWRHRLTSRNSTLEIRFLDEKGTTGE